MIRILLLGLVLAGVWYLYRMVTLQKPGAAPLSGDQAAASVPPPANDQATQGEAAPEAEPAAEAEAAEASPPRMAEAEELMECPLCQAYVPESAHDGCGRPDCPIPTVATARAAAARA